MPHFLIDICEPTETLTLAQYQEQAQELLGDRSRVGEWPLLVGGTGLYIKAITKGLKMPRVPPQPELRSQLQGIERAQLYAQLVQVDPVAASKIHPNDRVRITRALEVYYVTGCPISQQQGEAPPSYPILTLGLEAEPEELARRIEQRSQMMVRSGLIEEVEYLCQKYGRDLPLLDTLGYREIKFYLDGEIALEPAIAQVVAHTRQFAKQQRTWFGADPKIEWYNCQRSDLLAQVWERIQAFQANFSAIA